jgi:hypothetical protein
MVAHTTIILKKGTRFKYFLNGKFNIIKNNIPSNNPEYPPINAETPLLLFTPVVTKMITIDAVITEYGILIKLLYKPGGIYVTSLI